MERHDIGPGIGNANGDRVLGFRRMGAAVSVRNGSGMGSVRVSGAHRMAGVDGAMMVGGEVQEWGPGRC